MKIYIDGIWDIGKSTICKEFERSKGFLNISEPVFPIFEGLDKIDNRLIDEWYIDSFIKYSELSSKINENTILERSLFSALTYMIYMKKDLKKYIAQIKRFVKDNESTFFVLLDFDPQRYFELKKSVKEFNRDTVDKNTNLIETYNNIFREVFIQYMNQTQLVMVQSIDNKGFVNTATIVNEIFNLINSKK